MTSLAQLFRAIGELEPVAAEAVLNYTLTTNGIHVKVLRDNEVEVDFFHEHKNSGVVAISGPIEEDGTTTMWYMMLSEFIK